MDTNISPWVSCDLKVVAFLVYSGFKIEKMGKRENRAFFEFEETPARREAVMAFWNRTRTVEPVAFLDSLNRVRDMVSETMRS